MTRDVACIITTLVNRCTAINYAWKIMRNSMQFFTNGRVTRDAWCAAEEFSTQSLLL